MLCLHFLMLKRLNTSKIDKRSVKNLNKRKFFIDVLMGCVWINLCDVIMGILLQKITHSITLYQLVVY